MVLMFQLFLWKPTTTYLMFHVCDQPKHKLVGVNRTLKCKGVFTSSTSFKRETYKFDVYVTDSQRNLFGQTMAQTMNLVKLNIEEIKDNNFDPMEGNTLKSS